MTFTGVVVALAVHSGDLPRTEVTLQDGVRVATFVVPGSNGPPVAVGGVPTFALGDTWTADLAEAPVGLVPRGLGAGLARVGPAAPPWVLNGLHYDAARLPIAFVLNLAGSDDVGGFDATAPLVEAALAQWSDVGCATFAFRYDGPTDLGFGDDGTNVLSWEETSWAWGDTVLGLTATRFGVDADGLPVPVGADIVFNGVDWTWTAGPGDAYGAPPTLNLASVLVHELGHVTGMDHEPAKIASTMFPAYLGGDWMATLAGDDRRGLCANYPSGAHECDGDEDCAALGEGRVCAEIDGVRVCDEVRDGLGAPCSRTSIACAEVCVFTNATYTDGYCSQACGDCPDGYVCGEARRVLPDLGSTVCVVGDATDTGAEDTSAEDSGVNDTARADTADTGASGADAARGCACAASTAGGPSGGATGGPAGLLLAMLVSWTWRSRWSRSSSSR